jgi:hypothetical protein
VQCTEPLEYIGGVSGAITEATGSGMLLATHKWVIGEHIPEQQDSA